MKKNQSGFYRNYEPVFSISPKIRYVVSLEEKGAYSVFSISLCYRNAIFGFYTLDQFLYETITFDDSFSYKLYASKNLFFDSSE